MAETYNFPDHIKGDTIEAIQFTVTVNGSALDLTDAAIRMDVRTQTGALLHTYQIGTGFTVTNAAGGIFEFDEQIVDLTPGTNHYDIEFTLADETVKTYIAGTWVITQDVTYD